MAPILLDYLVVVRLHRHDKVAGIFDEKANAELAAQAVAESDPLLRLAVVIQTRASNHQGLILAESKADLEFRGLYTVHPVPDPDLSYRTIVRNVLFDNDYIKLVCVLLRNTGLNNE
jgi:hypothetical protein